MPEAVEGAQQPRGRVKTVASQAILLAVSVVVALVLGEVVVRLAAPQQLIRVRPDVWQPVDTLGWTRRPDVETTMNTGERTVHVYTDGEGYRVGAEPSPEADREVLVIGDSFLAALQVEYEQSLAGLLERRLSRRAGKRVVVRNAATDGWDANHYLLRVRSLLARDSFDVIVVGIYVGNDAVMERVDRIPPRAPAERHDLRFPRRLTGPELVDAVLYPLNDMLETRSHLFVFLKNRLQTVRMRLGLAATYFPVEFRRSEAESPRWRITAEICDDIAAEARDRGIPTVFVLIPAPYQVDRAVFEAYVRGFGIDSAAVDLDQPNRLLGTQLRHRGLTVVDALPALRAAHRSRGPLYGSVDRHLSPAGNRVLADAVEPVVAEALSGAGAGAEPRTRW